MNKTDWNNQTEAAAIDHLVRVTTGLTHCTLSDESRGHVRTLCGRLARAEDRYHELDYQHPTCPRCAALLAEREAAPLPAWAQEGLAKVSR